MAATGLNLYPAQDVADTAYADYAVQPLKHA